MAKVTISRRQFGASTAAALACASRLNGAPVNSGWIDAHVHVWTPDTKKYPLDKNFKVADMRPPSFTPEELFAHTKPAGVDRIVLIQMSFYNFDNRYMLDTMRAHPGTFSGVAIVDHRDPDVAAKMRELAKAGVRGFRLSRRTADVSQWSEDKALATVWETATKENLAICPLINPEDLPFIDILCEKYPETTVVIDHFARVGISGKVVGQELKMLCDLARHKQTHVKTSAFYALGQKTPPYTDLIPMIRRVFDAYGPDRLMWASDCPYQVQGKHDYEASIALIRDKIDFLSDADKTQMLRGTAERLFF